MMGFCTPLLSPKTAPRPGATPTTGIAGCCFGTYVFDQIYPATGKIQQLNAAQNGSNGQTDSPWKAHIQIDCASNTVTVTTRIMLVNKSGSARYPGSVVHTGNAEKKMLDKARAEMKDAARKWSGRSFKLQVTDRKCRPKTYRVIFNPREAVAGEKSHIEMHVIDSPLTNNLPEGPGGKPVAVWRSYVAAEKYFCKLNVQSRAFSHEYAHMLGLKDEYYEVGKDRGGVKYILPDGTQVNGLPNKDAIQKNETPPPNLERDADILNSVGGFHKPPRHIRNCTTIAYTVRDLLNKKGHGVTSVKIL